MRDAIYFGITLCNNDTQKPTNGSLCHLNEPTHLHSEIKNLHTWC